MDRLVFGDVGFGKTEMAIRAALLAVRGGRQVAVGRGVPFRRDRAAMASEAIASMASGATPSPRPNTLVTAGPRAHDSISKATFKCFQKKTGPAQRLRGTVGRAATRRNGGRGPA